MACDFQNSQEKGKSVNYPPHWDYNKAQLMNLKYSERHYSFILILYIIFLGLPFKYTSISILFHKRKRGFCHILSKCAFPRVYIFHGKHLFQIAKTLLSNNLERCVGRYYANLLEILLICFDHLPLIICKFRPCYW